MGHHGVTNACSTEVTVLVGSAFGQITPTGRKVSPRVNVNFMVPLRALSVKLSITLRHLSASASSGSKLLRRDYSVITIQSSGNQLLGGSMSSLDSLLLIYDSE